MPSAALPASTQPRYGGPELDDAGRCQLLLSPNSHPIPSQRNGQARFRCVLCAASPDGRQCRAEGTCEGLIAPAPAGTNGFGYDPVFLVPAHAKTMAQLDPQLKNLLSHRAQALAAMRPLLASTFPELAL